MIVGKVVQFILWSLHHVMKSPFRYGILVFVSTLTLIAGAAEDATKDIAHRSPTDVAIARQQGLLVTANETSNSVSLISLDANRVLDELVVGEHPSYIDVTENEEFALVSCMYSGEVVKLRIGNGVLREAGRVRVGFEPVGLAIADDTDVFYVGCTANGTVAEVSLETMNVTRVLAEISDSVERWRTAGCGIKWR